MNKWHFLVIQLFLALEIALWEILLGKIILGKSFFRSQLIEKSWKFIGEMEYKLKISTLDILFLKTVEENVAYFKHSFHSNIEVVAN